MDPNPDPVGSGLFWATRIRIRNRKTRSADPDPKKMDRIRTTGSDAGESREWKTLRQKKLNYRVALSNEGNFKAVQGVYKSSCNYTIKDLV